MFSHPEESRRWKDGPSGAPEAGWRQEVIASTAEEVCRLVNAVVAAMSASGYGERDVFGMRLALEEALVNAVKHGHGGDPAKRIRLGYCVTPERVLAEVEDQGPGFDAGRVPDPRTPERLEQPGGRGLLLMREYLTSVRYLGRGNRVCLRLERSPA
jgi:serine/threonine-protein kinase RsbW